MCALKNIEQNTKLTNTLVRQKTFDDDKFIIIDVGARGGFRKQWRAFNDQFQIIGFEPDLKECTRLNKKYKSSQHKFYPIALSKTAGKRKFYITNYPASSGFYKPNMEFYKRLPSEKNMSIRKIVTIKTITLDSFLKKNKTSKIDFIKLDIEGAELDVLKGAKEILKKSVFGLSIEISFNPLHINRPTFSQLDSLLSSLGFTFFDLSMYRYGRRGLSPNLFSKKTSPTEFGQAIIGQAVYLKDAVSQMQKLGWRKFWNEKRILKLASFMEIIKLQDCAVELLQEAEKKGVLEKYQSQAYINLLTPTINGRVVNYNQYLSSLKFLSSQQIEKQKQKQLILYSRLLSVLKILFPLFLRKSVFQVLLFLRNSIDATLKTTYVK